MAALHSSPMFYRFSENWSSPQDQSAAGWGPHWRLGQFGRSCARTAQRYEGPARVQEPCSWHGQLQHSLHALGKRLPRNTGFYTRCTLHATQMKVMLKMMSWHALCSLIQNFSLRNLLWVSPNFWPSVISLAKQESILCVLREEL